MQIPFVNLKRQYLNLQPAIDHAYHQVIESGQIMGGAVVSGFEHNFAVYLVAVQQAEQLLSIPVYPELTDIEVEYVVESDIGVFFTSSFDAVRRTVHYSIFYISFHTFKIRDEACHKKLQATLARLKT